ncbi:MAG TPA: hypothetical protein VF173_09310 [Thermoanaerobaculia bacterium]|nr:hypothetical protein [Thermoanaerobaculia bacterium]
MASVPSPAYDDWLRVVRRHLTPPLCSLWALDRLHTLAAHLPGDCLGALEAHLGKRGGDVDLSIRFTEPGQGRRMAEQPLPAHLRSFLSQWSQPEGPFSSIPCIWLEFDLDRPVGDFPVPSVCARLPRDADLDWIVELLLPALHGEPLGAAQTGLVRRCHGEIPEEGILLYVFGLLSRPGNPIRLEIFGLDPAGAVAYLRRVAPHAAPALAEIAPIFEGIDRPHLSLDMGAEILPRVGLEGSFARQREPRWTELLARLVARGLCTREEMDAILAWPGYDTLWTAAADWPLEQAGVGGFCVRSLSHVKVVAQPGRAPEAKVYLLVSSLAGAKSPARRSVFST